MPRLDCLVVGAGPAGLTAALYLRRFHRDVLVVDAGQPRALRIDQSWNLPGFPNGISGEAFLARLRQQLEDVDGEVVADRIKTLERLGEGEGGFVARGEQGAWQATTVVLATGTRDQDADLPGMHALKEGRLLRECPICDGHEHSNRRIGVIGASAHGAREALFLRHYSEHVHLLAPSVAEHTDEPDWLHGLQARGIPWTACGIREVARSQDGVRVTMADSEELMFDVLYSALGCQPGSDLARSLEAACDETGNLVVDAHCQTNVPGLYAAGDVTAGLNQVVVALAQGALAAAAVHNRLCAASRSG